MRGRHIFQTSFLCQLYEECTQPLEKSTDGLPLDVRKKRGGVAGSKARNELNCQLERLSGEHFYEADPAMLLETTSDPFFDEPSRDNWGKGRSYRFAD